MCDDGYFEIDWKLKCERCGKKPAVDLSKAIPDPEYSALCEKCGVEVFSESVVAEWAGTDLYLAKYPEEVEVYSRRENVRHQESVAKASPVSPETY